MNINLPPREILAIDAALRLACADFTAPHAETFPGLSEARDRFEAIVRDAGYVAQPETSVQSQMMIDGVAPWPE